MKYSCPICKNKFNEFLPLDPYFSQNKEKYGNPYNYHDIETLNVENYQCPFCYASDRDRLYAIYLTNYLKRFRKRDISLLDIAPTKPLQKFIKQFSNIKYISIDKFNDNVDIKIDISNMKCFESEVFDFFICSHVLEHIDDDIKALSELYRVLKKRGKGILMVPINLAIKKIEEDPSITDIGERWRRFGQGDHVRMYSKEGFISRILDSGFSVRQYREKDYYFKFRKYGITKSSVLYIVSK